MLRSSKIWLTFILLAMATAPRAGAPVVLGSSLSATAGTNGVFLGWDEPNPGSNSIEQYHVYRATYAFSVTYTAGVEAGPVVLTPSTSVEDISALGGYGWIYGVQSYDTDFSALTTNAESFGFFPAAPAWISASATGSLGQVALTWDVTASPWATAYRVYRATFANPAHVAGDTTVVADSVAPTGTVVSAAPDGVVHYFWVAPLVGSVGAGPAGGPAGAVPLAAPSAPGTVAAVASSFDDKIQVSWGPATPGTTAVQGYVVTSSIGGVLETSVTTTASVLNAVFTGVTRGVDHSFDVTAIPLAGSPSPASSPVVAQVPVAPDPQNFSTLAGQRLTLQWLPAAQTMPVSRYLVRRATFSAWVEEPLTGGVVEESFISNTQTSFVAPTLVPGRSEYYRLYTYSDSAAPVTSSGSTMVSALAPPSFSNVAAAGDSLSLTWASTLSAANPGVTGYRVYYRAVTDSADEIMDVPEPGAGLNVAALLADLSPGLDMEFSVASLGGGTVGSRSVSAQAKTEFASPLITWADQAEGGPLTLSWTASVFAGHPVAHYELYRGTSVATASFLTATTQTQYVDVTAPATATVYFTAVSTTTGLRSSLTPTAASQITAFPLAAPASTGAVASSRRVSLAWSPVSGATHYRIFRATYTADTKYLYTPLSFTAVATTAGTDWIDPNGLNGLFHGYQVVARAQVDPNQSVFEGPRGALVEATPSQPPGSPGPLSISSKALPQADGSAGSVSLAWSAAPLGTFGLGLTYDILRGTSAATVQFLSTTAGTSYLDNGRPDGTSWTYQVLAVDSKGNSGPANAPWTATMSYIPAGGPQSASVAALGSSASLAWAGPTSASSYPVVAYDIYRSFDGYRGTAGTLVTRTTQVSYSDSGPNPVTNPRWFYDIYSVDGLGAGSLSPVSAKVEAVFSNGGTVSQVVGVTMTSGVPDPTVSWAVNPLNENVTTYHVYESGSLQTSLASPLDNYTFPAVAYGTTLSVQIQADNGSAVGVSSTAWVHYHRPPAPQGLTVSAQGDLYGDTNAAATLSWTSLGPPVAQYFVFRSTASISVNDVDWMTPEATVSSPSYRDTGITPGINYYYRVQAFHLISGTASAQVQHTAPAAPGSVTGLSVVSSAAGHQLSWSLPGGSEEGVAVYTGTSPIPANPVTGGVVYGPISGLLAAAGTPGIQQYFGVAAVNSAGRSVVQTTSAWPIPQSVSITELAAGFNGSSNTISLTWTAASPSPTYYIVRYDTNSDMSGAVQVTTTSATTYTHVNPTPTGASLYYDVSVFHGTTGSASTPASALVAAALPSAPGSLVAEDAGAGVKLTWDSPAASEAVTGYRVYRATYSFSDPADASLVKVVSGDGGYCVVDDDPLFPGLAYYYGLAALNHRGEGAVSVVQGTPSSIQPPLPPQALTAVSGIAELSPSLVRVELRWLTITTDTTVQDYVLYRSTAPIPAVEAKGGAAAGTYLDSVTVDDSSYFLSNGVLYSDFSVTVGTTYHYALTAVNGYGPGVGESQAVFLPQPVLVYRGPGPVTYTLQQAGVGRVDLAWSPPSDVGSGGGPVTYKVYRLETNGVGFPALKDVLDQFPQNGFPVSITSTSFVDIGFSTASLNSGSTYRYFVSAVDSMGREGNASLAPVIPGDPVYPTRSMELTPIQLSDIPVLPTGPGGMTVISGDNRVRLQWLVSATNQNQRYNVYRRYAGPIPAESEYGVPVLSNVGPQAIEFAGLGPNAIIIHQQEDLSADNLVAYYYAIAPVTSQGEGLKSQEWTATPYRRLDPGSATATAKVESGGIRLAWQRTNSAPGTEGYAIAGYNIYRSLDAGANFTLVGNVAEVGGQQEFSYLDNQTSFGVNYAYRIVPQDSEGHAGLSYPLLFVTVPQAANSVLIYRNSFNPAKGEKVGIQAVLTKPGKVWIKVYTSMGRFVETIDEFDVPAGTTDLSPYLSQRIEWDGTNFDGRLVASGVYLIHIEAEGFSTNGRVAVIK